MASAEAPTRQNTETKFNVQVVAEGDVVVNNNCKVGIQVCRGGSVRSVGGSVGVRYVPPGTACAVADEGTKVGHVLRTPAPAGLDQAAEAEIALKAKKAERADAFNPARGAPFSSPSQPGVATGQPSGGGKPSVFEQRGGWPGAWESSPGGFFPPPPS